MPTHLLSLESSKRALNSAFIPAGEVEKPFLRIVFSSKRNSLKHTNTQRIIQIFCQMALTCLYKRVINLDSRLDFWTQIQNTLFRHIHELTFNLRRIRLWFYPETVELNSVFHFSLKTKEIFREHWRSWSFERNFRKWQ